MTGKVMVVIGGGFHQWWMVVVSNLVETIHRLPALKCCYTDAQS